MRVRSFMAALALAAGSAVALAAPAQAAENGLSFGGCISDTGSGGDCVNGAALVDVRSVTVSPDGKNAYAASFGSDAVVVFNRNTLTGALSFVTCHSQTGTNGACADSVALDGATSVTISPDGKNAYVASHDSDTVVVFNRNTSTGALSFANCFSAFAMPGCIVTVALDGPTSVTVSPDGKNAYVASGGSDAVVVFDRDSTTGALTPASCVSNAVLAGCVTGGALDGAASVAIAPDGKSAYLASFNSDAVAVFTRNTGSGTLTYTTNHGNALNGATSVTVSPDSKNVYATSGGNGAVVVFDRNTTTGALTYAGCFSETGAGGCMDSSTLDVPESVTVSPDGKNAYVASWHSAAVAIFDRNATTGALTPAGCIGYSSDGCAAAGGALGGAFSVAASPDGNNVYVAAAQSRAVTTLNRQTSVYRFWSSRFNNAHFFTASKTEADNIRTTDPNWTYEGIAFKARSVSGGAVTACLAGGSPVYRFYSAIFASHFYTISATERDTVLNDSNWSYEGPTYCAFTTHLLGSTELYRFWSPVFHKHFFTSNAAEADHLKTSDPNWNYEGIAYYVLP